MAGARGVNAGLGRTQFEFLRLQRGIAVDRGLHPATDVERRRQFGLEVLRQRLERTHFFAGDFLQRAIRVFQRIAGDDSVGAGAVVLRAGFVHVGDRGEAYFKALVGEVELLL